jgi:hypothetical protein
MIQNFTAEIDGTIFTFNMMHTIKLQLFQVYVLFEGKKTRFHMQRKDSGEFYLCDKASCPEIYQKLEPELNQAILSYGKSIGAE